MEGLGTVTSLSKFECHVHIILASLLCIGIFSVTGYHLVWSSHLVMSLCQYTQLHGKEEEKSCYDFHFSANVVNE